MHEQALCLLERQTPHLGKKKKKAYESEKTSWQIKSCVKNILTKVSRKPTVSGSECNLRGKEWHTAPSCACSYILHTGVRFPVLWRPPATSSLLCGGQRAVHSGELPLTQTHLHSHKTTTDSEFVVRSKFLHSGHVKYVFSVKAFAATLVQLKWALSGFGSVKNWRYTLATTSV